MATLGQWDTAPLDLQEVREISGYLACQERLEVQVKKHIDQCNI